MSSAAKTQKKVTNVVAKNEKETKEKKGKDEPVRKAERKVIEKKVVQKLTKPDEPQSSHHSPLKKKKEVKKGPRMSVGDPTMIHPSRASEYTTSRKAEAPERESRAPVNDRRASLDTAPKRQTSPRPKVKRAPRHTAAAPPALPVTNEQNASPANKAAPAEKAVPAEKAAPADMPAVPTPAGPMPSAGEQLSSPKSAKNEPASKKPAACADDVGSCLATTAAAAAAAAVAAAAVSAAPSEVIACAAEATSAGGARLSGDKVSAATSPLSASISLLGLRAWEAQNIVTVSSAMSEEDFLEEISRRRGRISSDSSQSEGDFDRVKLEPVPRVRELMNAMAVEQ